MKTEATIVGAGPTGLIAAQELAKRGFNVRVFEEHPIIGEPCHCTGILSVDGIKRLNIEFPKDIIQQEIRGGTVYSSNGAGIRVESNQIKAYALDRSQFDKHLASLAEKNGAIIETNKRIKKLVFKSGNVSGIKGEKPIESKIVIDAEGVSGVLARSIGLPQPNDILSGLNVEISGVELEEGMVEVWLGKGVAPGFFGWVIPIGNGSARCGLANNEGNTLELLKKFIRKRFGLNNFKKALRWFVITGGPVSRTHTGGFLIVGDVAGQTKPTTGGGIILGGLCAVEAAKTTAMAFEADDFSAYYLKKYDKMWQDSLGGEFSSMLKARRFLNSISDDRINRVFSSVKAAGIEQLLSELIEKGDMDLQSGVFRTALTSPSIIRVLARSLGHIALQELRKLFNL